MKQAGVKQIVMVGLALAVVLQFLLLTGMVLTSAFPLVSGKEIRVKTMPVDPRSLFRGNYARLGYEFSSIPEGKLPPGIQIRTGEVIYLMLAPDPDESDGNFYRFDRAVLDRPDTGIFLRGRAMNNYGTIRVRCGIEAFFAPKEEALALERELRDGAVAVLMVASNGRVRIREIISK